MQQQLGILTMIVVTVLFGILMVYYSDLIARDKGHRPSVWKIILIGTILVVITMVVTNPTVLPASRVINPVLNPWVYIVSAVIAFLGRGRFRQKYHVVDPLQIKRENRVTARRRNRRS